MEIKRNVRKMAELGVALTAIAALLVAGCGGGGGGGGVGAGGLTNIPVNLNNDPLINARTQVTCANGVTGSSLVGSSAVPGIGSISVDSTCKYPIKIATIANLPADGKALMRPIAAASDVEYNPDVNFPVAAIVITPPVVPVAVTPVTTMVANQALAAASAAGAGSTLGSQLQAIAASSAPVATAQENVLTKLGIPKTDFNGNPISAAEKLNKDYADPEIAGASKRLAQIAIMGGSGQAASAIAAGKTIGQYMAEQLASAITNVAAGSSSVGITNALSTAVGIASASEKKKIEDDANRVTNMVTQVINLANSNPASGIAATTSAGVFSAIQTNASNVALSGFVAEQKKEAAKDDAYKAVNKMLNDVVTANKAAAGLTATQIQAKNDAAVAACAAIKVKVVSSFEKSTAASSVADIEDVAAKVKAGADTVKLAIVNDTDHVFATPPAIGATSGVSATALAAATTAGAQASVAVLVSKVMEDVKNVTAATLNAFTATTAATNASKIVKDISSTFSSLVPPPVPGGADAEALNATLKAIASTATSSSTVNTAQLANIINAAKASMVSNANTLVDDPLAESRLEEAAKNIFTTPIDFAAPPAPGQLLAPPTVQTTTTTAYVTTSTLARITTTTTTTTTTHSVTTTTLPPCDPFAAPPAPGTAATCTPSGSTTTAATTTTTRSTTTTTLPPCDPLAAPPAPGTVATCTPSGSTTAATTTSTAATTTSTAATTTSTAATTTTVPSTTTTTLLGFTGSCQVAVGSAIGYVTGVPSAASCTNTVLGVDGGGATVSFAPATLVTGKTQVTWAAALTCDPFGAPPAAGATTLTPCKQ